MQEKTTHSATMSANPDEPVVTQEQSNMKVERHKSTTLSAEPLTGNSVKHSGKVEVERSNSTTVNSESNTVGDTDEGKQSTLHSEAQYNRTTKEEIH